MQTNKQPFYLIKKSHLYSITFLKTKRILSLLLLSVTLISNISAQTPQWELMGLVNEQIRDIVIEDSNHIYVGCESGVFKSTDSGASWVAKNNGLDDIIGVQKLFIDYSGNIFLAAIGRWHDGLYKSTNNGDNWIRIVDTLGSSINQFDDIVMIPNQQGGYLYVSNDQDGVFRSTDNGNTWQFTNFSDPGALNIGMDTDGFMFFTNNTASWFGIYRSTNLGINWERQTLLGAESIAYLKNGELLAGCYDLGLGSFGIYKSLDNGNTWINTNTFSGLSAPTDFVIDTNNDIYVAIGGQNHGIYLSTNNGGSWSDYGLSGTEYSVLCLAIDSSGYLWAGTNFNGVYRTAGRTVPVELVSFSSEVNGNNVLLKWITVTEINNMGIEIERSHTSTSLSMTSWETIGFVAGHGTTTDQQFYSFIDEDVTIGTYNYRLKQIDFDGSFEYSNIIEVEVGKPINFYLSQNFPNPFNPITQINYYIKEAGLVQLKVYNILGSEIATLVNTNKEAGNYAVDFNASQLPSGVYIYKMSAGNFTQTNKMMLMK